MEAIIAYAERLRARSWMAEQEINGGRDSTFTTACIADKAVDEL
jgi:hypothetical protein